MFKLPEKTGVLVETPDGVLDLANVTWQKVASCGCVAGVAIAADGVDLRATAEQAGRAFVESAAEYKRDVERGFTFRPREHRAAVDELRADCPHTPRFGYDKPPTPEGMVWAGPQWGRRAQYLHLVPTEAVASKAGKSKPLCGGEPRYWSDGWFDTDGKVECKRCSARARVGGAA